MTLDDLTLDPLYATLVAEDAIYVDASGDRLPVRVIPDEFEADLGGGLVPVSGTRKHLRVRVSQVAQPGEGDCIEHGGRRHRIDGYRRLNNVEWLIHVIP